MNKKLAFTIAEALISMLLLSIFIGLSMKIFTKKHTKPVYNPTHGYVVCYRGIDDGLVYRKSGSAVATKTGKAYCDFTPVKSANYYVIYAVGGGGGGTSESGGAPGEFTTLFVTNIADPLKLYPGEAGLTGQSGKPTRITNTEATDNEIMSVSGGLPGGSTTIKRSYIRNCQVVPLASFLNVNTNKTFLSNNQADKAECEVKEDRVVAKLCPHSLDDIQQYSSVTDFYKKYADRANAFYKLSGSSFYNPSVGRYTQESDCVINSDGSARFCLDKDKGDKLYKKVSGKWVLSDMSTNGTCRTVPYLYSQIEVVQDVDSKTVVKTYDNFKFILDLQYDMSKLNGTKYIKASGFGKYLESSAMKDSSTAVLYKPGDKTLTSNDTSKQFDPSMGDGGYQNTKGFPGAVLIAW